MNSGISQRALSGAARVASLCALLLGLGCSDSTRQNLPGSMNTSKQAAAATDLTATESVNNGVHSYTSTLPPVSEVGTITQTLEASWDPSIHTLKDAPVYPQYWNISYYAGSTQLPATPATLSQWASVSRVVASGNIQVEALDGDRQAIVSTIPAPPVQVATNFSSVSQGDGWDVFFDPAYTRVYNIHHHGDNTTNKPATLMCRNLTDSSTCPGFPMTLTQTSHRSTGHIDATSNKLWQPTVTFSSHKLAWDCVNLTTATRCATPVVVSEFDAAPNAEGFYNDHVDPVVIGRKMYSIGYVSGNVTRLTCLDMATGTECPGIALPQNGTFYHSGLAAVGTRLYVLPGANLNLDCYESTTLQRCAGAWPKPVADSPVWGVRGADGIVNNVCASNQCFALDGSAHTLPPNFAAYLAAHPVVGLSYTYIQVGSATSVGTKAAWSITENQIDKSACWDMVTDAKCAPAFPVTVPRLYTTTLDPQDPQCLWTNGDDGIIRNWKTTTGAQGCSGGPPRLSFRAQISIPRLGCDPASRVYLFKSFKLVAPNTSQYTSATLTVKDSDGAPIAGWINVPVPANATVDLTGLTTAIAGVTPTFDVSAAGFTDTTVIPTAEFRVTTGSAPQLCWDLSTPTLVCPAQPGLALSLTPTSQATAVTAKGSYATGSGTTNFTDQVLNTTVLSNPPTFENCNGTRLRATVTSVADGSPVAGAVVFLLDSAGNPILNAMGQPASAVTAADGTVEFPVWAAGYTLKMSGTTSYTPVYANVTAGGSGTTFPSNGTVVSNTVTTTVNQVSHVAIAVTVPQQPNPPAEQCAPVITGPPGGTVIYTPQTPLTGTAEPGTTVTVRADGQTVCTAVVDAQGMWSCTAQIPVGTSTLVATSTDSSGNTSDPSGGVLITRRDGIDPPVITGPSGTVRGPGATVTGISEPNADITVKDENGNTVCTTKADNRGAWKCDGTFTPGEHQLTAEETWQGFQGTSSPHEFEVNNDTPNPGGPPPDKAWFQGSGCASAGGAQPALMMMLALGGLMLLRRRRA